MIPMMCLRNRHPINLILLALFTICISFSVGLGCLSTKGNNKINMPPVDLHFDPEFHLNYPCSKRPHQYDP